MSDPVTYPPDDRPAAWVEDDGRWYRGRIHSWHRTPDGWVAVASWHIGVGLQRYQDVPADRLRDGAEPDPNGEDEAAPEQPWR